MLTKILITLAVLVFYWIFNASEECQRLNQGYINYIPFLKILSQGTFIHISKLIKVIEHSVNVIINYRAY